MGTLLADDVHHSIYGVLCTVLRRFGTFYEERWLLAAVTMRTFCFFGVDHVIHGVLCAVFSSLVAGHAVEGRLFGVSAHTRLAVHSTLVFFCRQYGVVSVVDNVYLGLGIIHNFYSPRCLEFTE